MDLSLSERYLIDFPHQIVNTKGELNGSPFKSS